MRWGVDKNEDGQIDHWKAISAEEVSAEIVSAIQDQDAQRFAAVLLSKEELRNLGLSREYMVGAASLASLAGDAAKTSVFAEAGLLGPEAYRLALAAIPLMFAATLTGRTINRRLGETGYSVLFWSVMGGYTVRLLIAW